MGFHNYLTEKANPKIRADYNNFHKALEKESGIVFAKTPISTNPKSPHYYELRADVGNDVLKFFSSIRGMTAEVSDVSISGTYDTYKIHYKKEYFYFVNKTNRSTSKSKVYFNTKDLAPDNMGVGGSIMNKSEIKKRVEAWLMASRFDSTATSKLIDLTRYAYDSKDSVVKFPDMPFGDKDLKTISKDFGEVLAGFWLINNQKFSKIEFPAGSNFAFVDLFAIRGNDRYSVSVKSGGGSSTPMSNIVSNIMNIPKEMVTKKEEELIKVMKIIALRSLDKGPLEAAGVMETDSYKIITRAMGVKSVEYMQLVNFLAEMPEEEIRKKFSKLFELSSPSDKSFQTLSQATPDAKVGLLLGPLTLMLVKELNSDENKSTLSNIVRKVDVHQLNVDVKKDRIIYSMKKFSESSFKFSWGGGATTYKRVRVGFKIG